MPIEDPRKFHALQPLQGRMPGGEITCPLQGVRRTHALHRSANNIAAEQHIDPVKASCEADRSGGMARAVNHLYYPIASGDDVTVNQMLAPGLVKRGQCLAIHVTAAAIVVALQTCRRVFGMNAEGQSRMHELQRRERLDMVDIPMRGNHLAQVCDRQPKAGHIGEENGQTGLAAAIDERRASPGDQVAICAMAVRVFG